MRGGYLHNQAIAAELVTVLERRGAFVRTEYPVGPGRRAGSVDIYAELGELRLVCEVELGPRRVLNDVRKAESLAADVLLIVTPTAAEARVIRKRLRTCAQSWVQVRVRPMGLAIKYLSEMSAVECRRDIGTKTRLAASEGER